MSAYKHNGWWTKVNWIMIERTYEYTHKYVYIPTYICTHMQNKCLWIYGHVDL